MGPAKTGWTVASRHTYAASVTRGGRELLLTLLDSPDKWTDAMILFNWGFAQASRPRRKFPPPGDEDNTAPCPPFRPRRPAARQTARVLRGRANEQ